MPYPLKELDRLYTLLAEETGKFSLACADKCPDCCTVNVTATSLEAAYIFDRLDPIETGQMLRRLTEGFPVRRYQPGLTANGFARACMEDSDMPEEENDPHWGSCPFLEEGRCTIYRVRPLGCRVMVSDTLCRQSGFAQMPPFLLTLSNVLAQVIEEMDVQGRTGNFLDLVAAYGRGWDDGSDAGPPYLNLDNIANSDRKEVLLKNQPIPALMVPPEHREKALPLIRQIRAQARVGGRAGKDPSGRNG